MSVRQAVDRAMRSGRVVTPEEFEAIYSEAVASLDIQQLHTGEYLFRGADATALRRMRFRNDETRREFVIGLLGRARERVLSQLAQMLEAVPVPDRSLTLGCFSTSGASSTAVSCFRETEGALAIWAGHTSAGEQFYNGLLAFLGRTLPATAFHGVFPPNFDARANHPEGPSLASIQLLDGIFFTVDNFQEAGLPADTRISSTMIRSLYRSQICTEASTLPDCR